MNRLFVAKKPIGISSNHFLSRLKKKYNEKKAGFSGTLDPFAGGVLVVGMGQYTKLFNYLKKTPKIYQATIWLGAFCESGDNENITQIDILPKFELSNLTNLVNLLTGKISYTPPKYSAKKINSKRAYELARSGVEFELKSCEMEIFEAKILHYFHPFLSVRLSVSEGSYIRSWAEIFAKNLGINATLSSLWRLKEGDMVFENEKSLNPLEYLNLTPNEYFGDPNDVFLGKKLDIGDFKIQKDGEFILKFKDFFSIIIISNNEINYKLNRIVYADTH